MLNLENHLRKYNSIYKFIFCIVIILTASIYLAGIEENTRISYELSNLNSTLENVNTKLEDTNTKLDTMNTNLSDIHTKIDELPKNNTNNLY